MAQVQARTIYTQLNYNADLGSAYNEDVLGSTWEDLDNSVTNGVGRRTFRFYLIQSTSTPAIYPGDVLVDQNVYGTVADLRHGQAIGGRQSVAGVALAAANANANGGPTAGNKCWLQRTGYNAAVTCTSTTVAAGALLDYPSATDGALENNAAGTYPSYLAQAIAVGASAGGGTGASQTGYYVPARLIIPG